MYDMLKLLVYGLLVDGLKLECSDGAMTVDTDWIYADETYEVLDEDDEFEAPEELIDSRIPIRFYDIKVLLNGEDPNGVQTSFSFDGSNNHDQDGTIGFGSRGPQEKAQAVKRTIALSLNTTLTRKNVKDIMDARYGEVDAKRPTKCKLLKIPLELQVVQCEVPENKMIIKFPEVTLKNEFDMSGADRIETTMNMSTLGNGSVTLNDGVTSVNTDMYVKLTNKVGDLSPSN